MTKQYSVPPQVELLDKLLSHYGAIAEVARRCNKGHQHVKNILKNGATRSGLDILKAALAVLDEREKELVQLNESLASRSLAPCAN